MRVSSLFRIILNHESYYYMKSKQYEFTKLC